MPDDGAVAAVAEAPVVDSGAAESFVETPEVSTDPAKPEVDKTDGRRQPDALRKRISDLRRQADSIADPAEKQRLLSDAKELNNRVGKVAAYEQHFPTVREAREVKALVESFGGREGLTEVQQTLSNIQEIDKQLENGDPAVVERMWQEAPKGMEKLAPLIFSQLEKSNPQEYEKAVAPHAVKFLDTSGFPEAFDQMVRLYQEGKKDDADAISFRLARWVQGHRQGTPEQKTDPRVEQLERQLQERQQKDSAAETDRAYGDVVSHAGPVIDKYLKPIVARLGLSQQQYAALREDTWNHLQTTRNADPTYKTVASAKHREGMGAAVTYIKSETEARAQEAARARANFWYSHQLKNGAVTKTNATTSPITPGVTRGKEPSAQDIDYSVKGQGVAKKMGFKDLGDMILAGKAPMKSGGIRQWR